MKEQLVNLLTMYGGALTNKACKEELKLTTAEWETIKAEHLAAGIIRKRRGRGGSVQLTMYGGALGEDPSPIPEAPAENKPIVGEAPFPIQEFE